MDSAHQVIVAAHATNQTSDKQQAVAMVEETISNVGAVPKEVSADAGYYSAQAVEGLYALCVDPFVAPEQTRHGRVLPPTPRGRIPSHLSPRDRMRRKLQTKRGRQRYALNNDNHFCRRVASRFLLPKSSYCLTIDVTETGSLPHHVVTKNQGGMEMVGDISLATRTEEGQEHDAR